MNYALKMSEFCLFSTGPKIKNKNGAPTWKNPDITSKLSQCDNRLPTPPSLTLGDEPRQWNRCNPRRRRHIQRIGY